LLVENIRVRGVLGNHVLLPHIAWLFFTQTFCLNFTFSSQRNELDVMYNESMGELFDLAETRRALQARRSELLAECTANSRLQQRFDAIAATLTSPGEKGGKRRQGSAGSVGEAIPTVSVGSGRSLHASAAAMARDMSDELASSGVSRDGVDGTVEPDNDA
jgi:hypothetical protein